VPAKQPKRGRLWLADGSCIRLRPQHRNHVWAYDFVSETTSDGRKLRLLTVIDEYTRECLAIRVARRMTWARDEMLRLIPLHKLPIGIQPGGWWPAGLTPDWFSDYTAFSQAGIPIVAFESTNWEIGDLDGWIQTEEYDSFWHTSNDNLATIEELLPGRPMVRLRAYTTLVFEFLKHLNP
jgi:hypothetical protein